MTGAERDLIWSAYRRLMRTREMPTRAGVIVQHELAAADLSQALGLLAADRENRTDKGRGGNAR